MAGMDAQGIRRGKNGSRRSGRRTRQKSRGTRDTTETIYSSGLDTEPLRLKSFDRRYTMTAKIEQAAMLLLIVAACITQAVLLFQVA